MSFALALDTARKRPNDPEALAELASLALSEGEEELALPFLSRAEALGDASLWQWKGLLERSLDEHEEALRSFAEAARLDPRSASIAHGLARVALEAGVPSEDLFLRALSLSPSDGSILLGLAASRLAAGHGDKAEMELDAALHRSPLWLEGHAQLAQLRSMLGKQQHASASLDRALCARAQDERLWRARFDLEVKREDFAGLEQALGLALAAGILSAALAPYAAIAASEQGRVSEADRLFSENDANGGPGLPIWKIRHALRSGRMEHALTLIDRELAGPNAANAWPYAETAWRLAGDSRWEWLTRNGELVSTFDLLKELPPLDRLAAVLRPIHQCNEEYLDQSVRGGTQTDGPLFCRLEPEIRAVRSAVVRAIELYVARLPKPDPVHPLLAQRRDRRVRFAGSWSVRLRDKGYHASHVHPLGWISSALYIALPQDSGADADAGCLQLGEPGGELGLQLAPIRIVRPAAGKLVLFPSWMWHGTNPFPEGERLTIAFDVASPH